VKKTGAMAQVVEWLPCKHKALSSIPSTVKKKKKTENRTKKLNNSFYQVFLSQGGKK
jgi:hypothetical protein